MSKFHNPYHFVPVKKRTDADKQHDLPVDEARNGNWGGHSHAAYGKGLHSGRLVCRLTTESPVVIGAKQEETGKGQPKLIKPFELSEGRPAIPASSLRGMIAAMVEAASNSALRVLDTERPLSSRVIMGSDDVLSAIGMIVMKDNKLHLLPLAMPSLEMDHKKNCYIIPEENKRFKELFRQNPRMKSYIDRNVPIEGYCYLPSKTWSVDGIPASDALRCPSKKGKKYRSKADSKQEISENDWKKLSKEKQRNYINIREPNKEFVIGQKEDASKLLTSEKWQQLPENQKKEYCRGFLRILNDKSVRRDQMPPTKKHELFIPYPEEIEKKCDELAIPISDEAITAFLAMARERTCEQLDDSGKIKKDKDGNPVPELALLPFHPLGTRRSTDTKEPDKYFLTLKEGDLVYFDVDEKGNTVTRVSFSSIWRISSKTVGDYFPEELLPFNKKRDSITPAEVLFGFVQNSADEKTLSLSYKGKVSCSFGQLDEKHKSGFYLYQDKPEILKILGSPKLPCPTLYFKNKHGAAHIDKSALNPQDHLPQGRKDYLRRPSGMLVDDPWLTRHEDKNLTQKVKVTPVKSGLSFWFHIDFENLTEWELGLLCFAVQPTTDYRHKIGMGKPLGLGQIKIDPVSLLKIDREKRYTSHGVTTSRFTAVWQNEASFSEIPVFYSAEKQCHCNNHDIESFQDVVNKFADTADAEILNAIKLLGNTSKVGYQVHTPQIKNNGVLADFEDETFKWFVENDKNDRNRRAHSQQQLAPISGEKLPTLTYIDLSVPYSEDRTVNSQNITPSEPSKMSGLIASAFSKAQDKKK